MSDQPNVIVVKESNGCVLLFAFLAILALLAVVVMGGSAVDNGAKTALDSAIDYAAIPGDLVTWPAGINPDTLPTLAITATPYGTEPQVQHWEKGIGGQDMGRPANWAQMSRIDQNHWMATRDATLEALNE